jgi:hypothetical protein
MSLRFEVCACLRHGRYIGDRGFPVEVGSREMAKAMLEDAERNGVLGPGDRPRIESGIAASMMAAKEDWIEEPLRERLQLWNLAAATSGDPAAFAEGGFHAYHALVDGFGEDDPAA